MADSWMYSPANASSSSQRYVSTAEAGLSAFRENGPSPVSATDPKTSGALHARIRRRNRLITSCLECRRRKLKCDKQAPCANCMRFKRDCLFIAPTLDPQSQQKLADIKEKMGALEKNLEREVASNAGNKAHIGGANVTRNLSYSSTPNVESWTHVDLEDDDGAEEDEETLEPTPLAALDNVYEDNVDDELMDLGVQMGKMRITERVGGWIRPKLVEELTDTLHDVTGGRSRWSTSPQLVDHRGPSAEQHPKLQANPKSYIGPGPDYIAPASSFFFPGTNMNTSLIDYLPSRHAADQLVAQYFHAVHYVCRTVHRQTFEAQYTIFWAHIATGTEPMPSMQAIVFAAMFSAAVSMDDSQVLQRFGTTKATLLDSLRAGTEMALSKANFLRTTKLDTMQAFVMYLIPLIRAEVSRAHSALVGTAIRLAECMGLHRDGSHYSMTPVEVNVRRMIWHQLCFLDMRTCEATGPRPQIRPGDSDTKFPLNVDDIDLLSPDPPTEDADYWTDMTLFRIRAECIDLRRAMWFEMVAIDKKKKTLTSALIKIQRTKNMLDTKYRPMMDENVPFHMLGKRILTIGTQGCFIQVLHRYLFSTSQPMPDRLRQLLIEAGVTHMENSIDLEIMPELAPWAWYRGAFNQYHSALLLMVEVYAYPMRKDAAKIWKCLDYVFDIPPHLSPKQKAELVITDLRDRMEVYSQMRKLKTTTQMEERVGSAGRSPVPGRLSRNTMPAAATLSAVTSALPVNVNMPPMIQSPSPGSDGRKSSATGGDVPVMAMEDIDWAEWDKYFPVEENNGVIDAPDFDFTATDEDFGISPLDAASFAAVNQVLGGAQLPGAEDLSDVNLTMSFYPGFTRR